MPKRGAGLAAVCALAVTLAAAMAQAQPAAPDDRVSFQIRRRPAFSFPAFAQNPKAYVASRYARRSMARDLRADLRSAGFECRDARPNEPDLVAACERLEQTSRYCFGFRRVWILSGGRVEVGRDPRCMGVIPPTSAPR